MHETTKGRLDTIVREQRAHDEAMRVQEQHLTNNVETVRKAFEERRRAN